MIDEDDDGAFLRDAAKAISAYEGFGQDAELFRDRLNVIADRLELLEKAHSEQTRQMSVDKLREGSAKALLDGFVDWMADAHAEDPDNVEVEHFTVLALINLGTQLRAGARTMSMGSAIGGIGGLLGGIGAAAMEKLKGVPK